MPKLDSLKEDLKTLRFWLGVFVTSALAVAGWVATNYQKVELWFIVASVILLIGAGIAIHSISKRMQKNIKQIEQIKGINDRISCILCNCSRFWDYLLWCL